MKRISYRSRLTLVIYALLLSAAVVILMLRVHHIRQERRRPFGRLTAEQVLKLSQSICQAIAPYDQARSVSTAPMKGPGMNCWDIQCQNATGHELADLIWNANTGQIYRVGAFPPPKEDSTKPLLTAKEAVHSAYSYLLALQANSPSIAWRLVRPPLCADQRSWDVLFQAADRRARIQLQARSGNLLLAAFWQQGTNVARSTPHG